MIKKILFIISTLMFSLVYSQDLPSEPASGFAFPIGSKFSIKLYPVDSLHYNFSVIEFEPFEEIVDTWDNKHLFEEKGEDNTLSFYFCIGTHGETEEEKNKNMKVLLLMKNYSGYALTYSSDILLEEDGEFESTSNVGSYPGAQGMEMWPYMIYMIGLSEFQRMK